MSRCLVQVPPLCVLLPVLLKPSVQETAPASVGHFMKEMDSPAQVNTVLKKKEETGSTIVDVTLCDITS